MAKAQVELTAVDKTKAAFTSAKGNMDGLNKSVDKLKGGLIGLAGALGIGAFASLVSQTTEAADRVQKLAIQTNLSTEALSQLRVAAQLSGSNFEQMATSMSKLQKNAADAARGLSTPKKAFEDLGISSEAFLDLRPEDQLYVLADALEGVENPAKRTQLAMDTMGRAGRDMLPMLANGAEGLRAMMREADGLGATLDQETANQFAELSDTWTRTATAADGLMRKMVEGLSPALKALSNIVTTAILEFGDLGNAIGAYAAAALEFFSGNLTGAKAVLEAREKERAKIDETIAALWNQKKAQDEVNSSSGGGTEGEKLGVLNTNEDELDAELEMIEGQFERLGMTYEEGFKSLAEIQKANRDMMLEQDADYWDLMGELEEDNAKAREKTEKDLWKNLVSLTNSGTRELFEIGKVAAVAEATVGAWQAAQNAFKTAPWPLNYAAAAAALAAGFSNVQSIQSTTFGGGGGGVAAASAPVSSALPEPVAGSDAGSASSGDVSISLVGDVFSDEGVRNLIDRMDEVARDMGGNVNFVVS